MPNKKKIVFFYLLICTVLLSFKVVKAQYGGSFITNFKQERNSVDSEIWSITQDEQGLMLFANRTGILTFDGSEWGKILLPGIPTALQKEPISQKIYVGLYNGFGYLTQNTFGEYNYVSLSDSVKNIGEISSVFFDEENAYFYGKQLLIQINKVSGDIINYWGSRSGEPFTGAFYFNNELYVNVFQLGLHKIKGNNYLPIEHGSVTEDELIIGSHIIKNKIVLVSKTSTIFWFDGVKFESIESPSKGFIENSIPQNSVLLNDSTTAVSTMQGGVILLNVNNGKIVQTINYQTGLPDDEIYAIAIDSDNGIWVAHEFGISRVDVSLPLHNFSVYPGLKGRITDFTFHENNLYVATNDGVFYLENVKDFKEIESFLSGKPEIIIQKYTTISEGLVFSEQAMLKTNVQNDEGKKKSFFKRISNKLFKSKKRKALEKTLKLTQDSVKQLKQSRAKRQPINNKIKPKKNVRYVEATEYDAYEKTYALQSIKKVFKRVESLDVKGKQFISFNKSLLLATSTGIYELDKQKSKLIIDKVQINNILKSDYSNRLYVADNDGLFALVKNKNKWEKEQYYDELNLPIYSILETDKSDIWVGSNDLAIKINLDSNFHPIKIKKYQLNTNYTEKVIVKTIYNKAFFLLSQGVYAYNAELDSIMINTQFMASPLIAINYINSQSNITWINNGFNWKSYSDQAESLQLNTKYLQLLNEPRNIFVDDLDNIWVVNKNNEIYKIEAGEFSTNLSNFSLHFSAVFESAQLKHKLSDTLIILTSNSLSIRISAPFYFKSGAIESKYFIEGITHQWSNWSKSDLIAIPYLPAGNYTLHIKTRNAVGKESVVKTISFYIPKPLWKRWWAYLIYLILGIGLVVIIVLLRERKLKINQHLLEEKVALRTVQLQEEKDKSDVLLLNILPEETAQELKTNGKATARFYQSASVLFTDFKGFTKISEQLSPVEIVKELDVSFAAFDGIIEDFHLEKIKTIGDAYMCVGGIPARNNSNAIQAVLVGLHIREYMKQLKIEKQKNSEPCWELRLGIHTGPLIAGVIGKKKFAYDVWGDTVNTASRMESSGEIGKVNISEATYLLVKNYFDCTERGKIAAKNKGELQMYFVDGIKPKYTQDEKGVQPNEQFLEVIKELE